MKAFLTVKQAKTTPESQAEQFDGDISLYRVLLFPGVVLRPLILVSPAVNPR